MNVMNATMLVWQLMPFMVMVVQTVINIDVIHDGKISGEEKLAMAQSILGSVVQQFPSVASIVKADPTKLTAIINAAVTLMNLLIK